MQNKNRYLLLRNRLLSHGVMLGVIIVMLLSIVGYFQFQARLEDKRGQLLSMVKLQSSLMSSIARFDAMHHQTEQPQRAVATTLSQVYPALQQFEGFAKSGEVTIARLIGKEIRFFHSRQHDQETQLVIRPTERRDYAKPMQLALQQKTGTVIGQDYRGATVLAAYTWVEPLQVGVVVKIDQQELITGFLKEYLIMLILGSGLFVLAYGWLKSMLRRQVQQIEQSQTASQLLVESAGEAIYGIDQSGNCTFANQYCATLIGYKHPDQLLGKNMHNLIHYQKADGTPYPVEECSIYKAHWSGESSNSEKEVFWRKDGKPFPVEYTSQPILQGEDIIGSVVSFSDITEKLAATKELQQERDFYNAVLESAGALLMVVDENCCIRRFNRACETLTGYAYQEVVGQDFRKIFLSADKQNEVADFIFAPKKRQVSTEYAGEWLIKNGEIRTIEWFISLLVSENDAVEHIILIGKDISQQRQAEQALRKNNELLERIFNNTHTLIAYLDTSFNFIHANQAYLDADNITLDELIGKNHFYFYPDAENEKIFQQVLVSGETYYANARAFEYGRNPERGITHWNWSLQPVKDDGRIIALLLVLVDVTVQIEAQEALMRQEEAMGSAQAISHFGSWDWNILTGELSWSDEIYRIFGQQPQTLPATYENFLNIIFPDDREIVSRSIAASVENADVPYEIEHRLIRVDGEVRYVQQKGAVYRDETGRAIRMLGVVHDITERRDAEETLRSSIELNKTIIANSPVGIAIYEQGGQCIAANQAIADLVGARKEQVLQQNYHEIDSWKKSGLYDVAQQAFNQQTIERYEFSLVSSFEKEVSVDAYLSRFENRGVPHLLLMLNDISERKKADAELRIRDTAIAASINPIFMSNMEGRITYVNQAYIDMWGYDSADEILGRSPIEMSASTEEIESVVGTLMQKGSWQGEIISKRKDGTLFDTQISANVVYDQQGKPLCLMGSFIDVTERKQMLNELTRHQLNLESLVLERTSELENALQRIKNENEERKRVELSLVRAKDEAERANKLKSEFLGRMSHELRTPMNAILGFSQLLETEGLNEGQADFVQEISQAGQHLLNLINEVLDLTKIESGSFDLDMEYLPLPEIVMDSISMVQPMARVKNITFENQVETTSKQLIYVDKLRCIEVLVNLLSNAVKYGGNSGHVVINTTIIDNKKIRINVTDDGPGISKAQQELIFEPFNRLGAEYSGVEGTGIGLTIARQLMKKMNGRIGLHSNEGQGSTFWIEFPVIETRHKFQSHYREQQIVAIMPKRPHQAVLYIEDNQANLRLVQHVFSRLKNVKLYSAPNAELGIEIARTKRPELILLDINLPGIDGYEALSRLRNIQVTADIPVIAISASAMARDIERGLAAGFKHYVTKPIRVPEVLKIVNQELGFVAEGPIAKA